VRLCDVVQRLREVLLLLRVRLRRKRGKMTVGEVHAVLGRWDPATPITLQVGREIYPLKQIDGHDQDLFLVAGDALQQTRNAGDDPALPSATKRFLLGLEIKLELLAKFGDELGQPALAGMAREIEDMVQAVETTLP
jgi:hypothetical protein